MEKERMCFHMGSVIQQHTYMFSTLLPLPI